MRGNLLNPNPKTDSWGPGGAVLGAVLSGRIRCRIAACFAMQMKSERSQIDTILRKAGSSIPYLRMGFGKRKGGRMERCADKIRPRKIIRKRLFRVDVFYLNNWRFGGLSRGEKLVVEFDSWHSSRRIRKARGFIYELLKQMGSFTSLQNWTVFLYRVGQWNVTTV